MAYQLITKYTAHNFTPAAYSTGTFGYPREIKYICIHWWGTPVNQSFAGIINWFCGGGAPTSAHYVVTAGKVACIVAPKNIAWHAGNSRGNAQSIGIECDPNNPLAYATVAELIRDLRRTYGNLPIVGHSYWTSTACPGTYNLTKLDRLARNIPGTDTNPAPDRIDTQKEEGDDLPAQKNINSKNYKTRLKPGKWRTIGIEKGRVSILGENKRWQAAVSLNISGVKEAEDLKIRFVKVGWDGKKSTYTRSYGTDDRTATSGGDYFVQANLGDLNANERLRIQVLTYSEDAVVERWNARIHHWDK